MKNSDEPDKAELYCSFCGKSQHEVKKLIAGPSVYICNECVDLCNEIKPMGIIIKNNIGSLNMLYLIKVIKLLSKKLKYFGILNLKKCNNSRGY